MTRAAVDEMSGRIDVILGHQFCPFDLLVRRRLPRHIENLVQRPDVLLRIAMAIETPFHVKRLRLSRQRHLINAPVTRGATHTFCDVNAMIELHVAGQIVNPRPF